MLCTSVSSPSVRDKRVLLLLLSLTLLGPIFRPSRLYRVTKV
jgi:hypothetical protein